MVGFFIIEILHIRGWENLFTLIALKKWSLVMGNEKSKELESDEKATKQLLNQSPSKKILLIGLVLLLCVIFYLVKDSGLRIKESVTNDSITSVLGFYLILATLIQMVKTIVVFFLGDPISGFSKKVLALLTVTLSFLFVALGLRFLVEFLMLCGSNVTGHHLFNFFDVLLTTILLASGSEGVGGVIGIVKTSFKKLGSMMEPTQKSG